MSEVRSVFSVGDRVADRYVLERSLGSGGMGTVFVARDERLGRLVALKMVHASSSEANAQRLEAEARAVASLHHPGIVTLYDVVAHGGGLVLVMELVDGESLRALVARGPADAADVAQIVIATADALAAAHAHGIVHRDVKPDNLMRRKDGRIALLDFGIAKAVAKEDASPTAISITGTDHVLGTPAYLAPEQALGEAVSPATDQFALAVLAYELLTGAVPWRTENLAVLVADIILQPAAPPSVARPGLGPDVDDVFARALEKAPAARFPSVVEFARALAVALGSAVPDTPARPRARAADPFTETIDGPATPAVTTPTTSASTPKASPATPPRGVLSDASALASTAASALGTTALDAKRASETKRVSDATPPERSPGPELPPARAPRTLFVVIAGAILAAGAIAVAVYYARRSPLTPSVSASATSSSGPLLLEDLQPSPTDHPQAAERFRGAVHALSVGDPRRARTLLDEAIREDPRFASALLQRAYLTLINREAIDEGGRSAFREVLTVRDALSARDAEFLDAISPSFGDPPDWKGTVRRLDGLLEARPGDEQARLVRMIIHLKLGERAASRADADAAIALQPKSGLALLLRAQIAALDGDLADANERLSMCVDRLPENVNCRIVLGSNESALGQCAEVDRVGRGLTQLAPDNPYGYELRADGSSGLGAPEVAIAELLAARTAKLPESIRKAEEAFDAYRLAARRGDFVGALGALDVRESLLAPSDAEGRGVIAMARTRLLCESGDLAKCGASAMDFMALAATRAVPERVYGDPTPTLLAYAWRAGALDRATFHQRRDAWANGWRTRLGDGWRDEGNAVWLMAYLSVGDPTDPGAEADAREALDARARFEALKLPVLPLIGADVGQNYWTSVGALHLAAGELDEAKTYLERATSTCMVVPDVRAHYLLGLVHERRGDRAAACEAFGRVEQWWGKATPSSETVKATRAHAQDCR